MKETDCEVSVISNYKVRNPKNKFLFQIVVSPVLAAVAVGIGVPILLFYVYGVVPVSLCRSGGCGVTTSGAGVKFEFDDENDFMSQLSQLATRNQGTDSPKTQSQILFHVIINRL